MLYAAAAAAGAASDAPSLSPCRPPRPRPPRRCTWRRSRATFFRARLAIAAAAISSREIGAGSPSVPSPAPSPASAASAAAGAATPSGLWRQYQERVGSNSGVWKRGWAHDSTSSASTIWVKAAKSVASSICSRRLGF